MIIYLSKDDILLIHSFIIDETGGSHGIRDMHALLALEGLPKQRFGGKELYPTIFLKAALYARNIIFSHPFVDGNKRTGMTAASVFLEDNSYEIIACKGDIEFFAVHIVIKKLSLEEIAGSVEKNSGRRK